MKYDLEEEKPISENIGYPYNLIPKGYPNKIRNEKINEIIDKVLNNLKANAGVESIVQKDMAFINLGLNELNNRLNRKQSKIALLLSLLSLIVSGLAFIVSIYAI